MIQKKFATPTLTPTNCPQTSKNRKYERGYLENDQSWRNRISVLVSVALYTNVSTLTPTNRQACGAHNFFTKLKVLSEMY